MDFENLLKQIQEWTNRGPTIVLGSGASAPYGLPSMWALGEYLKFEISFVAKEDTSQFEEFKAQLDKLGDLELALQAITVRPNVLRAIVHKTWDLVNKKDHEAYEYFINEQFSFPLGDLLKHLIYPTDQKVSIVTTNYDRLAEYAASAAGAFICTGFTQNYFGAFSNSIHQNNLKVLRGFSGQVNIWKVHGSLDWFQTKNEESKHLPLRQKIPKAMKPSIVTPGLSKYLETHLEPYRTILSQADIELENANGFLCIGYGFNDSHVQQKLITQIKANKPIIVLTKQLTEQTKKAILDNGVKDYALIEEAGTDDTRIYSSLEKDPLIFKSKMYWSLDQYLKLIKS
ncbi:SIR2 family protein [Flavobacteriaceae bacterium 3-367]